MRNLKGRSLVIPRVFGIAAIGLWLAGAGCGSNETASGGEGEQGGNSSGSGDSSKTLSLEVSTPNNSVAAASSFTNVKITTALQTVDTLNGVPAWYRPGSVANDASDLTYSCAAFVNRYYQAVYNVYVGSLTSPSKMTVDKGIFQKIASPVTGDIVFTDDWGGHWAIVKSVSGDNVTLIEQNVKWLANDGFYYAEKDRVVTRESVQYLRWKNAGDVNQNGKIDINDALLIAQYGVGLNPAGFYVQYGDLNGDGIVNVVDAMLVAQLSVGNITYVPTNL